MNKRLGATQRKPRTTFRRVLPALTLAVLFSVGATASVLAGPQPHLKTGMFGVARDQIARINAVHIGDPGLRPIQIEMLFLDATGAVVGRDVKTIAPGQAVFFDLPLNGGREENRIELRALVNASNPPDGDKNLSVTVEVFEPATGKTTVFIGDPNL